MTDQSSSLAGILEKLQTRGPRNTVGRTGEPLGDRIPIEKLCAEMAHAELMMDSHPHLEKKGLAIYRAIGHEIPETLLEIGRLREETFRTVGEGSGQARDNDRFDIYYDHFWAWDKARMEITGAYRIGRVDKILAQYGPSGVYSNTLFDMEGLLKSDFRNGTLEAGRSFVRPEFQRGLSLLYIWTGLARFIAAHPQYKYLMGPVSISNEFQENSKSIMVSYLMRHHTHEKAQLVASRNPPHFDSSLSPEDLTSLVNASLSLSSLQDFVRMAEGDPKAQIPQLIKLYLELGVQFLAFNKDADFNTIDGLIWLDIPRMPENIGHRYFGAGTWEAYRQRHT